MKKYVRKSNKNNLVTNFLEIPVPDHIQDNEYVIETKKPMPIGKIFSGAKIIEIYNRSLDYANEIKTLNTSLLYFSEKMKKIEEKMSELSMSPEDIKKYVEFDKTRMQLRDKIKSLSKEIKSLYISARYDTPETTFRHQKFRVVAREKRTNPSKKKPTRHLSKHFQRKPEYTYDHLLIAL